MTRATMSVGPPAENDTMRRTGLDGYLSSAFAAAGAHEPASTSATESRSRRIVVSMWFLPGFFGNVSIACSRRAVRKRALGRGAGRSARPRSDTSKRLAVGGAPGFTADAANAQQ